MAVFKNDGTIYLMYYSQDNIVSPIAEKTFIGGTWEEIYEQNPFANIWHDNKKYSEWSYSYIDTVSASNSNLETLIDRYGIKSGIDTWELRVYAKKEEMPVLTYDGLKTLWEKISLEDYPNNNTLVAILNAIDETKADKIYVDNNFVSKSDMESYINETFLGGEW